MTITKDCVCEGEFVWACGPECGCWHHKLCRFRTGDSADECGLPYKHEGDHAPWALGLITRDAVERVATTERDADAAWTEAPTTPTGRRLFTDNEPGDMLESTVDWADIVTVEREAAEAALLAQGDSATTEGAVLDVERLADVLHAKVCGPFATIDPQQCVAARARDVRLAEAIAAGYVRALLADVPDADTETRP